jgi:hypothetical protein
MSKRKATKKYGIDLDLLDTFRFGIVLGAIGVILWGFINIIDVWVDHILLDILNSVIYFLFMFSGLTILIDYLRAKRN